MKQIFAGRTFWLLSMNATNQLDHLDLVQQALGGRKEALHRLAELSYTPLRSYVLRITFQEEITDDIVQKTLLEMYGIFAQLKQADRFWPWLCKIALNKVRKHSEVQNRHRRLLRLHAEQNAQPPAIDGLAAAINKEFHQVIVQSLSHLSDRQRAVLSMRCYENMSYSQIADIMNLSELGCRLLFVRAKKKLQNQLCSFGYGQKSLLLALVLFGKLTAPTEAAAARVALSPSVLNAGAAASAIALAASKTVLLTVGAVGVAAGAFVFRNPPQQPNGAPPAFADGSHASGGAGASASSIKDSLYFFPQGRFGPVLTRFTVQYEAGAVQILQNGSGNYTYDAGRQAAAVHSSHYWKPDLSVMTLPADSPALERFIAQIENRPPQYDRIGGSSENFFVMISGQNPPRYFEANNYNALMEEKFQYNWPANAGIEDLRDDLHRQGKCRVEITGTLHGSPVTGAGRLPFTYTESLKMPPLMKITVGQAVFTDSQSGTAIRNSAGTVTNRYPPGTLLTGLNRPWTGLHVIDTVRRDAAAFNIPFRTLLHRGGQTAEVRLALPAGEIAYTISMNRDWIERVVFTDSEGTEVGRLNFKYAQLLETDDFGAGADAAADVSFASIPVHWLSTLSHKNPLSDWENKK